MDSPLAARIGNVPGLDELLTRHPHVSVVGSTDDCALQFTRGEWTRRIFVDNPQAEQYGLVELMDNNPIVCTDTMSVPSPAGTLALIALGPLLRAGIVREDPAVMLSFECEDGEVDRALATMSYAGGASVTIDEQELGSVRAATIMAVIDTPESLGDIDALYEDAFGRSFFVRRDEASDWHVSLAVDKPYALYRVRIGPDEPNSLLTIRVMADIRGKCGAAQLVHALNVMAGFEESVGIDG